jgi:hypothetical protein
MTNFHIELDNKFDELISNLDKKNQITINDLINLKSFINKIYDNENLESNIYIKNSLLQIELKI